jgi:hypothetical protein
MSQVDGVEETLNRFFIIDGMVGNFPTTPR